MTDRPVFLSNDCPRKSLRLQSGQLRIQLPEEFGHCVFDSVELEPGLSLSLLDYRPSTPIVEESFGPHDGRVMVVTQGLQGQSSFEGDGGMPVHFQQGCTTVTSFRSLRGRRRYEAGQTTRQLRIVACESLIRRYLGDELTDRILDGGPLTRLAFRTSTPAAAAHTDALLSRLTLPDRGVHRLDLHIHALSVLGEQLRLLAPEQELTASPYSPPELKRVEMAYRMLCEHLDQPRSVEFLSASVGLNRNKLTQAMVYRYGDTPARLLLQLRMEKAVALLESGRQVAQVAADVGYNHASNFTIAFTRHFGRSPRAMFRKRVNGPQAERRREHGKPSISGALGVPTATVRE